jgi:hypothetical protein
MLFFVAGIIFGVIITNIYFLTRYGTLIGMYKTLKCRKYLDEEIERYLEACKESN